VFVAGESPERAVLREAAEDSSQAREASLPAQRPTAVRDLKVARSKAELVRTTVVLIVLCCQILAVLKLYGVT
jgi:hypothetical protein